MKAGTAFVLAALAEVGAAYVPAQSDQQSAFCVLSARFSALSGWRSPFLLPQMEASLVQGSVASLPPVLKCVAPAVAED